ncbi:amino acid adenylation domain-containing protein [Kitasatospora sp. NPDC004615]|uniref:amino acid adenylation domain-containing protein n=1 Tax=Kitasatospora sp. NPDC004615 TaxID=3364017 RepID=UPI0036784854
MAQHETFGQRKIIAAQRPLATAYWKGLIRPGRYRSAFPADLHHGMPDDAPRVTADTALGAELAAVLDRLTKGSPDALHTLLTAGVAALLHRYGAGEELTLAQPYPAADHEPLGDALPLDLALDADTDLRTALSRTREAVLGALEHRDYPLDVLAAEAGLTAPAGDNPLFDVVVRLAGLHAAAPAAGVRFDVRREDDGLYLTVDCDGRRYEAGTARRLGAHLALLLERWAAAPETPLGDLSLFTGQDAARLAEANATDAPFEDGPRLHELFERQVRATPDAPAVVLDGESVSYAEFNARANRLARTLVARGVGPDTVVPVVAERSVEMLTAVYAVLKAGGAYLPVDPSYPAERVHYLLRDSGAALVLARTAHLGLLPDGTAIVDLDDPSSYADADGDLESFGTARDLAYVIYTSGSTGNPKGVAVEHRSAVNRIGWMQRAYPIAPGDVVLQKTSISFDVSVWELFWWGQRGAAVCLLAPGGEKDPETIIRTVERHRVSTLHFVPSMLAVFLDYAHGTGATGALATLRQAFASGEALPPHLAARFAEVLPGSRLINLYGPTEATVDVTHHEVHGRPHRVPIGAPIDNTRLHVVDHKLRPQPIGLPGELCLAGTGLARGYLHRPELTAEKFVERPFDGEERVYRTGDLARWLPDGTVEYLGRIDNQVKIRGFRIEPGEIEEQLRRHPAVTEAVVVPHRGADGQLQLHGYAVAPAGGPDERELKEHLRAALPEHLVPARVVRLDALPVTPNGKLDRRALPLPADTFTGPEYTAPSGATEQRLAGIWGEVLGLERVGAHDSFFALGGNSIHFVSVLARSRRHGLEFTFQEFFQHPTVAELAALLDREGAERTGESQEFAPLSLISEADRALLPADAQDAYPMSMLQAGLIFQSEITRGTAQYHDIISYLITSPFDAGLFAEAVRILVEQAPILRTTFHLTGFSESLQIVRSEVPLPLTITDLRGRTPDAQQFWYEQWVKEERGRRFRWEEPGLISLHVQVLRDDLYRYNISLHNSALDGWSINLVHTRLFDIYYRLRDGRPMPEAPGDHLRNHVGLELRALNSPAAREFWAGMLDGAESTAVPRPAVPDSEEFAVGIRPVPIPAELSARIVRLADQLGVPVKNVLLAAHLRVLGLLAGRTDVLTGYEHSGRPELEGADRSIGMFLNTVPFRIELSGGSWAELIRSVYRAEIDLLPHRRYPMARMKQDAGAHRPLFETVFNFTHFYLLKELKKLPEFALLDVQVQAETEFVLRAEFSRHFFEDNVRLSLHHHADVLNSEQIDRMGGYYLTVLDLMTADPDGPSVTPELALAPEDRELLPPDAELEAPAPATAPTTGGPSAVQRRIAEAWSQVLGVPASRIGAGDDFFELGGNSLAALRVGMLLDGTVSLVDVMRYPVLGDLAAAAERSAEQNDEQPGHLQPLTVPDGTPDATLICFPYAAGNAANFVPLARELAALDDRIAVYAVELPGHDLHRSDEPCLDAAATGRLVAEEITRHIDGPVLLWGHCGGASVAVETARELERREADLRHLVIGAKLLNPVEDIHEAIGILHGMSDQDIVDWLIERTGYSIDDGLAMDRARTIATLFRHDVESSHRYLLAVREQTGTPLRAPLTFVVAQDDQTTVEYPQYHQDWKLVAPDLRLCELDSGGHYFIRTRAADAARIVREAWQQAAPTG